MTSVPPPGAQPAWAHPVPPSAFPEVPDGITPSPAGAAQAGTEITRGWKPWTGPVALLAALAGALAGGILVAVLGIIAGSDLQDPSPGVTNASTFVQDLCFIGAALLFARMAARPRPAQFGLRATRFWPALGWVALAYVGFIAFTGAFSALVGSDPEDTETLKALGVDDGPVLLVLAALLVCVMAPIAEEFLFRGYMFSALRNWRGIWPAAIVTGLIFGAIHAGSTPVAFLVPLAVFGFLLCLLYVRTRSLYPCMALHAINNSIAFSVTQHWQAWQVLVLIASALAVLTAVMLLVRQVAGPESSASEPGMGLV
jgi:membrane protease YdiL (CAAX protease family)